MKQTQWYCCRLFVSFGLFEHFLLLVSCLYILLSVLWEAFLLFFGGGFGVCVSCFMFVCLCFLKREKRVSSWVGGKGMREDLGGV